MYDTSLQDNQKEKQATGSLYNYPTALSTNTVKLFARWTLSKVQFIYENEDGQTKNCIGSPKHSFAK